ncbi:MAG: hypothetical protein ACYDH5_08195 [Acidimicrobiales bacterium]
MRVAGSNPVVRSQEQVHVRWLGLYVRPRCGRGSTRRRKRGSGGLFPLREGVWRVDVEASRYPVTGRRRRVSRTVTGTRRDAEVTLARLKVADHEKRLPAGGTNARSVGAAVTYL